MKRNKMLAILNFVIIFLTFFVGFQIIGLKNSSITYIILAIISGCLIYLCPKMLHKIGR
ncbi:hypothetical protein ACYUJ6_04520 [Clostridium sp. JNZ X4-2]